MEYLILLLVIGIMLAGSYAKKLMSDEKRLIISLYAGTFLIVWFWSMGEGYLPFQILVTVLALSSWTQQTIALRKKPVLE